jgi:hypothetical protein
MLDTSAGSWLCAITSPGCTCWPPRACTALMKPLAPARRMACSGSQTTPSASVWRGSGSDEQQQQQARRDARQHAAHPHGARRELRPGRIATMPL